MVAQKATDIVLILAEGYNAYRAMHCFAPSHAKLFMTTEWVAVVTVLRP